MKIASKDTQKRKVPKILAIRVEFFSKIVKRTGSNNCKQGRPPDVSDTLTLFKSGGSRFSPSITVCYSQLFIPSAGPDRYDLLSWLHSINLTKTIFDSD